MDICHTIKKIRNNISKSGDGAFSKRRLKFKNNFIEWTHFKQAYLWDISTNPFPVHHKLTQEHMFLTSENKMRNHLAEDVLNSEMLHLMKLYKSSLGDAGTKVDATIELLQQTSVLIQNFKDSRPITDRTLHNGANTNPTYLGYCHSVNSVILGQTSISRKSNAGGGEGAQLNQAVKANKKVGVLKPKNQLM
ncbi:Hypothetical predicted protein [Mytilus galloprovincialis]|uniref:Transposable element P transposase-like GTP-binding insertion domain-containing protein n=1 Tax=Mytilus galloprovincialis TaxID=29158 RepID=A0A8B6G558_MYTGA|nr:Hypothetical predicted protein [Mytilus galloprovincialis]